MEHRFVYPTSMKNHGYTLLEVLIGIMIIGIVFSLGVAQFRDFTSRQSVRVAGRQLLSDIREAQSQALSGKKPELCTGIFEGVRFEVTGSSGPPEYQIQAICETSSPSAVTQELSETVYIVTPLPSPILFRTVADGTNLPAGSSQSVTVCSDGVPFGVRITIQASGDISESEVTCP